MQAESIYCANQKTLKKKTELPTYYLRQSAKRVCPLNNERQQRKPVIDGIRNKKKKNKKFRITYNTKVCGEKVNSFKN